MRESKECLHNSKWYTSGETEGYKVIDIDDAEHAVKLAYKEGYLEARADILELLRSHDNMFMAFAIIEVREMKLPENLFK